MRRLALLLVLFVLALASAPQAAEPELVGAYQCHGTNPDGNAYTGSVEIQKHGDVYHLRWQLESGEVAFGLGIVVDGKLSVMAFAIDNDLKVLKAQNVAVYHWTDTDTLEGVWAGPFTDGVYVETLTKDGAPAKKPLPKPTHKL